jgi:hypothetical protein
MNLNEVNKLMKVDLYIFHLNHLNQMKVNKLMKVDLYIFIFKSINLNES